jgi:FeS assembly protein IscX
MPERCSGRGDEALAMGLKWEDADDLAEVLAENHPGLDPLDVRFTDLRQWVVDLDEFDDNRDDSSEGKLEAIQMAWVEIYKERNQDD